MSENKFSEKEIDEIRKRRIPCVATYIHPFRIVNSEELSPWETTLEQVNAYGWDYVALHEMVGGIYVVGLPEPYYIVVCRDGAIAVPPIESLRGQTRATVFFNRVLASFLLGGIYCEAIGPDGISFGSVIDQKYVRIRSDLNSSAPNRFHELIRMRSASSVEAIALENPRTVEFEDLKKAAEKGKSILDGVPELSGDFLLRGVTGLARGDWGTALSNLWITIEQITEHLWLKSVVAPAKKSSPYKSRLDQLADNRTWTVSARHEMLFQKGVIDGETYENFSIARKARNALSHQGIYPTSESAKAALSSFRKIIVIASGIDEIPFNSMDLDNHILSDPFKARKPQEIKNPKYFMEIKKLPGELELEQSEAKLRSQLHKNKT